MRTQGFGETFSEAPEAYGCHSGSNPARFASYETASALASRPSSEMGVATWHEPSGNHFGMPPSLQPVVGPLVSLGRCAPRAGVPACCGIHEYLCHRMAATYNGHPVSGVWTGPQLHSCELLAVHLALDRLKGLLRGKHVLVRTDNIATIAYINHQGGLHSHRMSQLTRHLLLWSQKHLRSLRAMNVPGVLNRVADELRCRESGDTTPRRSS